jgi:hypothetical protein
MPKNVIVTAGSVTSCATIASAGSAGSILIKSSQSQAAADLEKQAEKS